MRQPEPSHLKTQTPIVAKQNYICSNSGNHLLNTPSYMEFAFLQKPQRKYVSVGVRLCRNQGILQKRKNTPITAYIKFCLAFIIVACFRENCNSFFEKKLLFRSFRIGAKEKCLHTGAMPCIQADSILKMNSFIEEL